MTGPPKGSEPSSAPSRGRREPSRRRSHARGPFWSVPLRGPMPRAAAAHRAERQGRAGDIAIKPRSAAASRHPPRRLPRSSLNTRGAPTIVSTGSPLVSSLAAPATSSRGVALREEREVVALVGRERDLREDARARSFSEHLLAPLGGRVRLNHPGAPKRPTTRSGGAAFWANASISRRCARSAHISSIQNARRREAVRDDRVSRGTSAVAPPLAPRRKRDDGRLVVWPRRTANSHPSRSRAFARLSSAGARRSSRHVAAVATRDFARRSTRASGAHRRPSS